MQFYEIILSKREAELLKRIKSGKLEKTFDSAELFDRLVGLGFIESEFVVQYPGDSKADFYIITDKGSNYLHYVSAQRKRAAIEWARYIITTIIAVAALIISIISIAMQQS